MDTLNYKLYLDNNLIKGINNSNCDTIMYLKIKDSTYRVNAIGLKLVTIGINESELNDSKLNKYEQNVFDSFIGYINDGRLFINDKNVIGLNDLSNKLNINFINMATISYITEMIKLETCIDYMRHGKNIKSYKIYNSSLSFIKENFNKLLEYDVAVNLTFNELKTFIYSDDLNIAREDDLLQFLFRWNRHNTSSKYCFDLIQIGIRKEFLSKKYYRKMMSWIGRYIRNNNTCNVVFSKNNNHERKSYCYKMLPKTKKNNINVIDNVIDVNSDSDIDFILNKIRKNSTIYFDDKNILYLVGGDNFENDDISNKVLAFNMNTFTEFTIPNMIIKRNNPAVVFSNERLFVIGGVIDGIPMRDVESLKIGDSNWKVEEPLTLPRFSSSVVYTSEFIYVYGGNNDKDTSMEIYDIGTNTWTSGPQSIYPQTSTSAILFNDSIYLIGGLSLVDGKYKSIIQVYSIKINKWYIQKSTNITRMNPSLIIIDDTITVIGGYINGKYIDEIEIYDDITKEWSIICNIDIDDIIGFSKK
ncbi:kelch-like protein [Cotia virus SPAn232]|uniref:Kelch-like protein n=2 Tax=Cotia virus TaxID=39444 RepID=H6TAI9_9POXV|nr:kelch-like protein [Cotia virus SPAn232]AFB76926.1 kelch-like protein [Cotia virus SPAn232]AIT70651.1 kelch-like protein [Cotia virus]